MKTMLRIWLWVIAFTGVGFSQGTILWDESVNGPFSQDFHNPTPLTQLHAGTNSVIGTAKIEPIPGSWLVYEDIFTLDIPTGLTLTSVSLSVDKPDFLAWIGNPSFSSQLATSTQATNGDLMGQWLLSNIATGSYGMYVGNYDAQPFTSIANYRLDFIVQSIPEPSALWLLLGGLGYLGCRSFRRAR